MNSSHRDDSPVLITEAQPSLDDQQALRRRKYAIMMASRVPCLVLAAVVFQVWQLWWLSLIILAISIPLPWMAVLIANDRPARKSEKVNRFRHSRHALESREHQVIES
ncbi:Protein of unknown function [Saccharopolyspora antimicrobica]|uniref:DUF3099 domain-containing protein n=1 Tax=Saccharopolyspora antimicrobica TaxID=455193 RepID=A0A1I5HRZ1_9PSEU|nr:DUF3099 domain-containing protein [Saccharopolyspora antimicrobica]RKT82358.1 Protein of unknown function (DUF3099) [Saccharopolyspora antimicrobica]SFO51043.1 Protein of unknown function [Saccharopolyspora antimicrobica]